jgi:hypothetical protein
MTTYYVDVHRYFAQVTTVEADSLDEAEKKVWDNVGSLVWHTSDATDDFEVIVVGELDPETDTRIYYF